MEHTTAAHRNEITVTLSEEEALLVHRAIGQGGVSLTTDEGLTAHELSLALLEGREKLRESRARDLAAGWS